jgi:hypothetical protein
VNDNIRAARRAAVTVAVAAVAGCNDFGDPIGQPTDDLGTPTVRIASPASPVAMAVGDTVRFRAEFRDADGALVPAAIFAWSSSDTLVAVIGPGGLLQATAVGETEVRAASGGVGSDPTHVLVGAAPPQFATEIQPIFTNSCATAGCHSPPVQSGLDLRAGVAYGQIVNVASLENPALMRIAPGDPENSYLVRKVSDCVGCYVGMRMPWGRPPLPDAQVQLLRDWVAAGAAP